MPRKRKDGAPHARVRFGILERHHLINGECGVGAGCSLCHREDAPPCFFPLDMDLARSVWEQHRVELLAAYEWRWLTPRIPAAGEIWFDGVGFPPTFDPSWPEPARRHWNVLGMKLARQRAYVAETAEEYHAAMAALRALRDVEIGDE